MVDTEVRIYEVEDLQIEGNRDIIGRRVCSHSVGTSLDSLLAAAVGLLGP